MQWEGAVTPTRCSPSLEVSPLACLLECADVHCFVSLFAETEKAPAAMPNRQHSPNEKCFSLSIMSSHSSLAKLRSLKKWTGSLHNHLRQQGGGTTARMRFKRWMCVILPLSVPTRFEPV